MTRSERFLYAIAICAGLLVFGTPALAQDTPNILIIWGDDIGY